MPHPLVQAVMLATAIAAPAQQEPSDVQVVATRDPYRLSVAALREGQRVFDRDRATFAPTGILSFTVEGRRGGPPPTTPRVWLSDGVQMLPVPVAPDGRLSLPTLPAGKWRLETDRPRREISIRPLVLSAGSTALDQRLGDARLQCRVFWAMAKATAPLLAAPIVGAFDLAGACSSRRIGIYRHAPAAIRAAAVYDGGRVVPVQVSPSRRSYRPPVADRTISNDARLRIALE